MNLKIRYYMHIYDSYFSLISNVYISYCVDEYASLMVHDYEVVTIRLTSSYLVRQLKS